MQQFFKTTRRIRLAVCDPTEWYTDTKNEQGLAQQVVNGSGGAGWSNLANISDAAQDCNVTNLPKDGFTDFIAVSQIGFALPACSTIQDIVVSVYAGAGQDNIHWDWFHFQDAVNPNLGPGTFFDVNGEVRSITATPAAMGIPDLDAAQLNDPSFRVLFAVANNYIGNNSVWLRYVQLQVRGYVG